MNGKSLKEWLTERMELCRIRNYYRQFGNQPATHDPESSFDICPDSDWSALDGTMDDISAVYWIVNDDFKKCLMLHSRTQLHDQFNQLFIDHLE